VAASTFGTIKPGQGVGPLKLGDTRNQVISVLGRKKQDEEYTYSGLCPQTEIHWLDLELSGNGLFIYLRADRVFQIEAATPRYATGEGITVNSSSETVRRHYPRLQAYVLLHSGAKVVGGRDLLYLVDGRHGIAFEFYFNGRVRKRQVSKVIVFEPETEFAPDGCVSPPKELRKMAASATPDVKRR
jgi:hypothetical protein